MAICPIIVHFSTWRARSMHDVACEFARAAVRSKDAQKQLARTSLIYAYISYAILAWGSAYKTHIDKIQTKQNHSARLIFFATAYGEHTESAIPLLN